MSDFEKLEQEVKEQIDEEELYKDQEDIPQEEIPVDIKDIQIDQALYYIGLVGARIRKASNPSAFAQNYANMTAAMLKMIGFESAMAHTLSSIMLDPKKRFLLGIAIIAGGLFLTPADLEVSQ